MTIWTVESLAHSRADFTRLTEALDRDLPRQRPNDNAQHTLRNLATAAALGVQDVIVVAENGAAVAIASIRLDHAAHVGNGRLLYALAETESAVADMLVQEVLERVWRDPAIHDFDGQTFIDQSAIRAAFAARGVQPLARQHMLLPLGAEASVAMARTADLSLQAGYDLAPWLPAADQDAQLDGIAELIITAYDGTLDAQLYAELNTRAGLRQFFAEIIDPGRGLFDAEASRVIRWDAAVGAERPSLAAQIFCARERLPGRDGSMLERLGVLEIATHPQHQRQGLGRALLQHAIRVAIAAGLDAVQLQVTLDNPARHLYESLGFQATTPFWGYTMTRGPLSADLPSAAESEPRP